MNLPTLSLLIAGGLVIAVLAAYAIQLWRKVWQQNAQLKAAEEARQQRLAGDLRSLADDLLAERLPLIEGAIRIKVVLDNYSIALSNHEHCRVFHALFDATSGIPSHTGWKVLSAAERRAYERHFSALELQHKAAARRGARWLLDEGLRAAPTAA